MEDLLMFHFPLNEKQNELNLQNEIFKTIHFICIEEFVFLSFNEENKSRIRLINDVG